MVNKLLVPDIGDFENVEIIEILVKIGQKIKKNDPIVTIESDKSSVEIPSVYEGVVESIGVKIGDKVSKGDLLITLNTTSQIEEKPQKTIEETIPKDTEKIIEEAEKTLVTKDKPDEKKTVIDNSTKKKEKIDVIKDGDIDPTETKEWLESLSAVLEKDGKSRAQYLIKQLI